MITELFPAFHHDLPAPVWRLVFEQTEQAPGLLLAELRTGDTRTLQFSTFSLPDGAKVAETTGLIPFHASVVGLWRGFALYHRYDNDRLPVPTALGCFDARTGQHQWLWAGHELIRVEGDTAWARQVGGDSLATARQSQPVPFQLTTGEPKQLPWVENPEEVYNPLLQFPVSYPETSSYWPVLVRFLTKWTNQTAVGPVEYLEIADKLIFSYYFREQNDQLRLCLLITDRQQTIWLHQPLDRYRTDGPDETSRPFPESTQGQVLGSGSFCVWQHQVIILPSPTRITSYFLTQTP